MRTETSGGGYADQIANILSQLQSVYGTPGGDGTLENALNNFTTSLQSLSNSPGNSSAQAVALSAAQTLARQLNSTTQGIQALRSNVEQDIGNSANQANTDLTQIADINTQLQGLSANDPLAATLMDQRDNAINDLAKLVDIRVVTDPSNQTNIFTNSGLQLVGAGSGLELHLHFAGRAERDLALQRQSGAERRRLACTSSCRTAPPSTSSPITPFPRARSRPT